jgi:hypothetical protein
LYPVCLTPLNITVIGRSTCSYPQYPGQRLAKGESRISLTVVVCRQPITPKMGKFSKERNNKQTNKQKMHYSIQRRLKTYKEISWLIIHSLISLVGKIIQVNK